MKVTPRKIYLSAVKQDTGKTTLALGLFHHFMERGLKTAFIKPVGQKYVEVGNERVDKDSFLINTLYHCHDRVRDMSPVTVGRGFTEEYIFNPRRDDLSTSLLASFRRVSEGKDIVIIEGTGHAGVGSVFDFSNAAVAALLESKTLLISGGGIGRSIDEIMLNSALFKLEGVEVAGVVVNKVLPEKYDKIRRCVSRGLENKHLEFLGAVPYSPVLARATVRNIRDSLDAKVLCGEQHLDNVVESAIIAAMEPQNTIRYLGDRVLVITPGDRADNILIAISAHHLRERKGYRVSGIVLTGGIIPHFMIMALLKDADIPVLICEYDTYTVSSKIQSLTAKIDPSDTDKIRLAQDLVERYIDSDRLLELIES